MDALTGKRKGRGKEPGPVSWMATLLFLLLCRPALGREITDHHHAGDRLGLHGMALFGKSVKYLAHIPMTQRPHNEQLIVRVSLQTESGEPLEGDFSRTGHSLKPLARLSLDDLVVGEVGSFKADVFRGNFEHQAPKIHANVTVRIEQVLIARNLKSDDDSGEDGFYLLGDDEPWLLNIITPARNRQEIIRTRLAAPAPGLSNRFALTVGIRKTAGRDVAILRKAGKPGPDEGPPLTEIPIEQKQTIWCLDGPDFMEVCK